MCAAPRVSSSLVDAYAKLQKRTDLAVDLWLSITAPLRGSRTFEACGDETVPVDRRAALAKLPISRKNAEHACAVVALYGNNRRQAAANILAQMHAGDESFAEWSQRRSVLQNYLAEASGGAKGPATASALRAAMAKRSGISEEDLLRLARGTGLHKLLSADFESYDHAHDHAHDRVRDCLERATLRLGKECAGELRALHDPIFEGLARVERFYVLATALAEVMSGTSMDKNYREVRSAKSAEAEALRKKMLEKDTSAVQKLDGFCSSRAEELGSYTPRKPEDFRLFAKAAKSKSADVEKFQGDQVLYAFLLENPECVKVFPDYVRYAAEKDGAEQQKPHCFGRHSRRYLQFDDQGLKARITEVPEDRKGRFTLGLKFLGKEHKVTFRNKRLWDELGVANKGDLHNGRQDAIGRRYNPGGRPSLKHPWLTGGNVPLAIRPEADGSLSIRLHPAFFPRELTEASERFVQHCSMKEGSARLSAGDRFTAVDLNEGKSRVVLSVVEVLDTGVLKAVRTRSIGRPDSRLLSDAEFERLREVYREWGGKGSPGWGRRDAVSVAVTVLRTLNKADKRLNKLAAAIRAETGKKLLRSLWGARMLLDQETLNTACKALCGPNSVWPKRAQDMPDVSNDGATRRVAVMLEPRWRELDALLTTHVFSTMHHMLCVARSRHVGGVSRARLRLLESLRTLVRGRERKGTPDDAPQGKGSKHEPGPELAKLNRRIVSLREDIDKRAAAEVVQTSLAYGSAGIVVEGLKGSGMGAKAHFQKYLKLAADMVGLPVREVPAYFTSQIDPATGKPALRCREIPATEVVAGRTFRDGLGNDMVSAIRETCLDGGVLALPSGRWDFTHGSPQKVCGATRPPSLYVHDGMGGGVLVAEREGSRTAKLPCDISATLNIGFVYLERAVSKEARTFARGYKDSRDRVRNAIARACVEQFGGTRAAERFDLLRASRSNA